MYESRKAMAASRASRVALFCFSAFCFVYGVGISVGDGKVTEKSAKVRRNFSTRFRRLCVWTAMVVFVAGEVHEAYSSTTLKPSLLHIAKLAKFCSNIAIMICGGVTMMCHDGELSRILHSNEIAPASFCARSLSIQLVLTASSFLVDVDLAVESVVRREPLVSQMGNICGIYVWPLQYLTFYMYAQIEAVVRRKLLCLSETMRQPTLSHELAARVASSKSSLRGTIREINDIFSNTLITIYVKVFFLCVYHFGSVILWKTNSLQHHILDVVYFVSSLMQIVQVYVISCLGTDIIREFQSIESALFKPSMLDFDRSDARRQNIAETRAILEYREDFDSLKIVDNVANSKANMFTYIATMFTGTAIFLQFDYDVLSALERSKKFPSIWKE